MLESLRSLADPAASGAMLLSLKTLAVAAPCLAVAGVGLGYALGRGRGTWASCLDFLVTLPLVFPPIATGFLLLLLLGRRSAVGGFLASRAGVEMVFSFWGVALAAWLAGLPLIVKPVQAAIRRETGRLVEAAYVLGKSRTATFLRVVLPSIRRSVWVGLFLALARCLGEVGITLMLGGNIVGKTNTVSLEIYNAVFSGEYDRALALVLVLGLVSLALVAATRRLSAGD